MSTLRSFSTPFIDVTVLDRQMVLSWQALVSYTFALLLIRWVFSNKPAHPLPPGPKGWPVLGNLLELNDRSWHKFSEWKSVYGPLVYINIAGQNAVVINSHKVAADLLDRRAGIYSDRAKNIVTGVLTGGLMFAFSQHNDLWKRMRRGAHEAMHMQVAKNYHGHQEAETVLLVEQLLKHPNAWDNHIRRAGVSLMMSILYGVPPLKDSNDPVINRVNHFSERALHAANPGSFLVEYFNWMQYLPRWMSPWRRYAEDWFSKDSVMFKELFQLTSARKEAGDDTASVCGMLIDDQRQLRTNLTDVEGSWVAANLYSAGAETTSGQMAWFFMAMQLYPRTQKAAQEEIDRVVGRERMPSFRDFEQMAYIRALVKECLRWRSVTPLGGPHRLCQDDIYEGMLIPADTVCIVNVYGLNHDPEIYGPDAEEFRPERHLDGDKLKPALPDTKEENHVTYGFGRRICVGRHVANNSLFIQIASVLWAFNITAGPGGDGKVIPPNPLDSDNQGLAVRPMAFTCKVTPRVHPTELAPIIQQVKENFGLQDYQ